MSIYSNVWATPDIAPMSEVDRLRTDAQATVVDLATSVNDNFVSKEEFSKHNVTLQKKLMYLYNDNKKILNQLSSLMETLNKKLDLNIPSSDVPFTSKGKQQSQDDNASVGTRRDADNDIIMKNTFSNPIQQVPEPGIFSGNTKETDPFCQLCEETFNSYPNAELSEDFKVGFVKSRLRDGARNWYLAKYKDTAPLTLKELIKELRESFSNVASRKLAKIQLVKLKHSYGKINEYIDQFRTLSNSLSWDEEALVLFFYNGLHPKFQEEIDKMEDFPTELGSIYTKCILFENSLKSKDQLRSNKNTKKKPSSNHINQNKNFNNNSNSYNYNKNYNNNKYNNNTNNNHNNNKNNNPKK